MQSFSTTIGRPPGSTDRNIINITINHVTRAYLGPEGFDIGKKRPHLLTVAGAFFIHSKKGGVP
jgi:hypothetical protein